MTDVAYEVNAQNGRTGANPISQVGRVQTNGRLDNVEIEQRKINAGTQSGTLYGGNVTDENFRVLPRTMCFMNRQQENPTRSSNVHGEYLEAVWSVLNGAGEAGETVEELKQRTAFSGFAAGDGAKYDHTAASQELSPHFALVKGGTLTVINQGRFRIRPGDWFMWDFPDPADAQTHSGYKGSTQVMPIMLPYTPKMHRAEARAIKARLVLQAEAGSLATSSDEAARNLNEALCSVLVSAMDILLSSGIVRLSQRALDVENQDARTDNARGWARRGNKADVLVVLAQALGCKNIQGSEVVQSRFRVGGETLAEYAAQTLASANTHEFAQATPRGEIPVGNIGVVLKNQRSLIADVVSAIQGVNDERSGRIIGKALTGAKRGEEFDALPGTYSA